MELHSGNANHVTSTLISPKLAAPDNSGVCLHFWFNLNGTVNEKLSLYITDDINVRTFQRP